MPAESRMSASRSPNQSVSIADARASRPRRRPTRRQPGEIGRQVEGWKASVPVISGFGGERDSERAGGAVAVERQSSPRPPTGRCRRSVAVPKTLAAPSVEPGPIGPPSQAAKRRSDGVDSFSAPSSFGMSDVRSPRR